VLFDNRRLTPACKGASTSACGLEVIVWDTSLTYAEMGKEKGCGATTESV